MNALPEAVPQDAAGDPQQAPLVPTPTGPRRATSAFVFVTVMLDMLALGVIIPVLPKLILSFLNGDTGRAAEIYGLFGTVWALMQFLFSPLMGALSDRFGRRPVILISNFGLGLDYIVLAVAPTLGWLLTGRVISGITAASISTSFAYIADVTPSEKRAKAFGLVGAAFGIGFVLGPALGGLLGNEDPRLPFWTAAALSLLNGLYGIFVLPESLPRSRRAALNWRRANPFGALKLLRSHNGLFGLAAVNFLGQFAHVVLPSTTVLYATYRYGWGPRTIGILLAAVGLCSAIVQGGLVGRATKLFGERRTLWIATVCGVVGIGLFGLAPNGVWFMVGVPIMALWGLGGPALQSLMTRLVGPDEQGRLQGATQSLNGIANMTGPGIFTMTFAGFIGPMAGWNLPGAPFLLASLCLAVAAVLAVVVTRPTPTQMPAAGG